MMRSLGTQGSGLNRLWLLGVVLVACGVILHGDAALLRGCG